jgi:small multidrug resistance pump
VDRVSGLLPVLRSAFLSINYIYLFVAILLEVTGTMLLPVTANFTRIGPTIIMAICYMAAFWLLTFAIRTIPISIVYATWSGLGVFTIAILGVLIFKQTLSWQAIAGLFLIVFGVILVNLYSSAH